MIGDKIFACAPLNTALAAQGVEIMTPVKLKKGQKYLEAADKLFSCYISSVRQPVESFFNWLIEKTAIQTACKVRSEKGLWVTLLWQACRRSFYPCFQLLIHITKVLLMNLICYKE